jgi:hypothetical protein
MVNEQNDFPIPLPNIPLTTVSGRFLRLDSFGVTEYVSLLGVCAFGHPGCLGRESHNLGLGVPYSGLLRRADIAFASIESHAD